MTEIFASYGEFATGIAGGRWSLEEEDDIDGSVTYSHFRVDDIPARQGGTVGNTLRRTLLRQDFFRSFAPVAFRLRHRSFQVDKGKVFVSRAKPALHEFASVPGVQESMIDVVRFVQHLTVAPGVAPELPLAAAASNSTQPDSWRWISRRCGPCVIQAGDLDVVDSSTFYERPMYLPLKDQHLLTVSAPAMVELEIEATCCSQTEWETAPAFEEYRQRLRFDRWLMVPPLFSPVKKVNFLVTEGEEGQEVLQLEIWTTKSAEPSSVLRLAAASLLAGLEARSERPQLKPHELLLGIKAAPPPAELPDLPELPTSPRNPRKDALSELLSSVQQDPSLMGTGLGEEDIGTLTDGLFDE